MYAKNDGKVTPKASQWPPNSAKIGKNSQKNQSEKHVEKHCAQSASQDVSQDPLHPSKRWFRVNETIVFTFPPVPPKALKIVPLGTPLGLLWRPKSGKCLSKGP